MQRALLLLSAGLVLAPAARADAPATGRLLVTLRPGAEQKPQPDSGPAEVIIAKQRNGPTAIVELTFLARLAKFENLEAQPCVYDYRQAQAGEA